MIKHFALVLSILSTSSVALAAGPFKLDPIACTVGTTEDISFDGSFTSKIRTELEVTGDRLKLPKIRLTFLEHEPTHVAIHWESIVSEKNGRQWFMPAISDRIRLEENKSFALKRVNSGSIGGAVFETEPLDFARSQDLMVLFLSQQEFIIDAGPDGVTWHGPHHLSGTDAAIRLLAAKCFPQLSAKYVSTSGRFIEQPSPPGLSPVASAYSEGYGLTEFSWLYEILPAELRASNDQFQLVRIYDLAVQKREALAAVDAAASSPDYLNLNETLTANYKNLTDTFARFEASDALITSTINEQQKIQREIDQLTAQIERATQVLATDRTDLTNSELAIAPHLQQMQDFDDQIKRLENLSTVVSSSQTRLNELLANEEQAIAATAADPLLSGPWSLEEIETQKKANQERQAQIDLIQRLKAQVEALTTSLPALLEKALAQQLAFEAYTGIGVELRTTREALNAEERWLQRFFSVPGFHTTPENFLNLNATLEAKIAEQKIARQFDPEFDFHSSIFTTAQAEFDALLNQAKGGPASLFASILCPPSVLVDPSSRVRSCLTVDDAVDSKLSEYFFYNLPPESLEALLGQVAKPWDQDASKADLLWNQFQSEVTLNSAELNQLVSKWSEIRFIIWRWDRMQAEADAFAPCPDPKPLELFADKTYSAAFYERVFQCQQGDLAAHQAERDRLIAALGDAKNRLDQAFLSFDQTDLEFDAVSRHFVQNALTSLVGTASPDLANVLSICILPLKDAQACAASVQSGVVAIDARLASEQSAYLELAKALVLNIRSRVAVLTEENRSAVEQAESLRQAKSEYLANNGVDALLVTRTQLEARLAATKSQLAAMLVTQQQRVVQRGTKAEEEFKLRESTAQLASEVQTIMGEIKSLLPVLNELCAPIMSSLDSVAKIDIALRQLIAPGQAATVEKMYSSCQMPSLDGFITLR